MGPTGARATRHTEKQVPRDRVDRWGALGGARQGKWGEHSWKAARVARRGWGLIDVSALGPANFHLSALEGVVKALPLGPVDAIGIGKVGTTQVEAIEIGEVAAAEPESS